MENKAVSWYPGHMAKAKRLLKEQLSRVDVVLELCDARLPFSSRNPDLNELLAGKPQILLLNKADLADSATTAAWLKAFRAEGLQALAIEAVKSNKNILKQIALAAEEKVKKSQARGISRVVRALVVGVPNVGKSTLINSLVGKASLKTADKPGITHSNQWVKVNDYLEIMDTPGLLWPRLGNLNAIRKLAYIAAIKDEASDPYELSLHLLKDLHQLSPDILVKRYQIKTSAMEGPMLLEEICKARGFLLKGNESDLLRGAVHVLDEFRSGKLGRISLENPLPHEEAQNDPG